MADTLLRCHSGSMAKDLNHDGLASVEAHHAVLEFAHILFDRADICTNGEQMLKDVVGVLHESSLVAQQLNINRPSRLRVTAGRKGSLAAF